MVFLKFLKEVFLVVFAFLVETGVQDWYNIYRVCTEGVGNPQKLLPEPKISPRRAAALEKQRISAQGTGGSGRTDFFHDPRKGLIPKTELPKVGSMEELHLNRVVESIHKNGALPSDYSLGNYGRGSAGMAGGRPWGNRGTPLETGRTYIEADIGSRLSNGFRNGNRVVFSTDGSRIYYTSNHYTDFIQIK